MRLIFNSYSKKSKNQKFTFLNKLYLSKHLNNYCDNGMTKKSKKATLDTDVLLVDDCKLQRIVVSGLLDQLGFSVTAVGSIEEALPYIKSLDCTKILISDIELTDNQTGLDLIRIVRAYHKNKFTPCIAVSSNENYRVNALNAGFDVFLLKPLTKENLKRALELAYLELAYFEKMIDFRSNHKLKPDVKKPI